MRFGASSDVGFCAAVLLRCDLSVGQSSSKQRAVLITTAMISLDVQRIFTVVGMVKDVAFSSFYKTHTH